MPVFTDQMNREVFVPGPPLRIVSLVPSQTELLHTLGLAGRVVGVTRFCVHPEDWRGTRQRVGGTKNINIETLLSLHPDLVIANKEENTREQVEAIARQVPVWISDVHDLDSALAMMQGIGEITGRQAEAARLTTRIGSDFEALARTTQGRRAPDTAYLIWKDPYMTAGGDTFISDILTRSGFNNIFGAAKRYPVADIDTLRCEVLMLSSEPYPFKERHREALQRLKPHTRVMLVNGELFSWYGSRLLHTAAYVRQLFDSCTPG